tara:strand:+ start:769 stop:1113 length:345 start_codon:yes stop_codon:yes gene_type:complete
MPRKFEGNGAKQAGITHRREAVLDRLRAAVDALDRENQALQAEVCEFQNVLGELHGSIDELADSTDGRRFMISRTQTEALRGAARRLGEIADNWQERCAQPTDTPSPRLSRDAA